MNRSVYREQDFGFGQLMLTLRTAIGITQDELATLLGVSRQSVSDWEAGRKYPKNEHLRTFITLAFQRCAFAAAREADDIRALWKTARQKVLLGKALGVTRRSGCRTTRWKYTGPSCMGIPPRYGVRLPMLKAKPFLTPVWMVGWECRIL